MDAPHVTGLRIGILGAGAVGTYVAVALIAAGHDVVLVGRRAPDAEVQTSGFAITDLEGGSARVPFGRVAFHTAPSALSEVDVVLCCVKSAQTLEAARDLDGVLAPRALVVSLQNGVGNAAALRSVLAGSRVLAGIVGFNVVAHEGGVFRRTTSGELLIEDAPDPRLGRLADALRGSGLPVKLATDIASLQWAKLLMNLNNAVSALSNVPTKELLFQKGYRRIIAALVAEALSVMREAGIRPGKLTPLPVAFFPLMLRLPTLLLRAVLGTQLKIDPEARSSMWGDLMKGRPTEVDYLNGEVVRLAASRGRTAPLNQRMVELVHRYEKEGRGSPGLAAEAMWAMLTKPEGS
jgi:2-dehydropantoate 2-reductase